MASTSSTNVDHPSSLLDKLAPASLARFDCFPKLPKTYRPRSGSRGLVTLLVLLVAALLVLNDVGEYVWGWPDYEFSVDRNVSPNLEVNLDMVVGMPCSFISIDLRDAMGDRLFLSGSLRREATFFDVSQASLLQEHSTALSVSQAVAQSRKSRGLFAWLLRSNSKPSFKPMYTHRSDGNACRITGSLTVKRVTANLHITTIGHGYASYEHVDHTKMNLSHIITEFSFGPFFPEIVQPLDNSFESTDKNFIAYQYYLHVVPTTYIAARSSSSPLYTAQYSVTHYTHDVPPNWGAGSTPTRGGGVGATTPPGIFFKFELDPLALTIHQRTTTLLQLLIRCVGVLGGTFVCAGYAIRATQRAVDVVVDASGRGRGRGEIVMAESTAVRRGGGGAGGGGGLRAKWTGGELRSRVKMASIGGGPGSPYASPAYMGMGTPPLPPPPPSGGGSGSPYFAASSPNTPHTPYSPNLNNNNGRSTLAPPRPRSAALSPGPLPPPPPTFASASGGGRHSSTSSSSSSNFPLPPLPVSRSPSPLPTTTTAATASANFEDLPLTPAAGGGGGSGSLGPYGYYSSTTYPTTGDNNKLNNNNDDDAAARKRRSVGGGGGEC